MENKLSLIFYFLILSNTCISVANRPFNIILINTTHAMKYYIDTLKPGHPEGYQDLTPLLSILREEGEYTSGYLTRMYEDGAYFEYTDKLSTINEKYEVEEKDVPEGWYPIVKVSSEGIQELKSYIINNFNTTLLKSESAASDIGITTYTANIDGKKFYWQKKIMYMNEEEVPMKIEYIINTNIVD